MNEVERPTRSHHTSHSIISSSQWGSSTGFNGIHGSAESPAQDLPLVWNTPFDTQRSASEVNSVQEQINFLHCSITMSMRAAVKFK